MAAGTVFSFHESSVKCHVIPTIAVSRVALHVYNFRHPFMASLPDLARIHFIALYESKTLYSIIHLLTYYWRTPRTSVEPGDYGEIRWLIVLPVAHVYKMGATAWCGLILCCGPETASEVQDRWARIKKSLELNLSSIMLALEWNMFSKEQFDWLFWTVYDLSRELMTVDPD